MSIFLTGDTHGDFHRFAGIHKKEDFKNLTHVIIAGDYGNYFWPKRTDKELYWEKWLSEKPFEILFIDGNHENFEIINSYPTEERYGGKVHKCFKNIYHLIRGEVYTIDGIKIFVFGGGYSIDKQSRIQGRSWWPEELPNNQEYQNGLKNLEKYNWSVDYIITHTIHHSGFEKIKRKYCLIEKDIPEDKSLKDYLEVIREKTQYGQWYCGHYHVEDCLQKYKTNLLYKSIMPL